MSHFIVKCKECNATITQCRCPDPNKLVEWGICDSCALPKAVSVVTRG